MGAADAAFARDSRVGAAVEELFPPADAAPRHGANPAAVLVAQARPDADPALAAFAGPTALVAAAAAAGRATAVEQPAHAPRHEATRLGDRPQVVLGVGAVGNRGCEVRPPRIHV